MNNFEIKYLIADEYINSVIREKKFDIDLSSKKLKIDSSIIKTLFPYSDEINKLEYLKLFEMYCNPLKYFEVICILESLGILRNPLKSFKIF